MNTNEEMAKATTKLMSDSKKRRTWEWFWFNIYNNGPIPKRGTKGWLIYLKKRSQKRRATNKALTRVEKTCRQIIVEYDENKHEHYLRFVDRDEIFPDNQKKYLKGLTRKAEREAKSLANIIDSEDASIATKKLAQQMSIDVLRSANNTTRKILASSHQRLKGQIK